MVEDDQNFDPVMATEQLKNTHLRRLLQEMNQQLDVQMEKKGRSDTREPKPSIPEEKRLEIYKKEEDNNIQILSILQRDYDLVGSKMNQLNSYDNLKKLDVDIVDIKHKMQEIKRDIDVIRKDNSKQGKNIVVIEQDNGIPKDLMNTRNLESTLKESQIKNDEIQKLLNWNVDALQKLQKNDDGVLTKKITERTTEGNRLNAFSQDQGIKLRYDKIQILVNQQDKNKQILEESIAVNHKLLRQEIDKKIQYVNLMDEQTNIYQMEIIQLKTNLDKVCQLALTQGYQVKTVLKISEQLNMTDKSMVMVSQEDIQKKYPQAKNPRGDLSFLSGIKQQDQTQEEKQSSGSDMMLSPKQFQKQILEKKQQIQQEQLKSDDNSTIEQVNIDKLSKKSISTSQQQIYVETIDEQENKPTEPIVNDPQHDEEEEEFIDNKEESYQNEYEDINEMSLSKEIREDLMNQQQQQSLEMKPKEEEIQKTSNQKTSKNKSEYQQQTMTPELHNRSKIEPDINDSDEQDAENRPTHNENIEQLSQRKKSTESISFREKTENSQQNHKDQETSDQGQIKSSKQTLDMLYENKESLEQKNQKLIQSQQQLNQALLSENRKKSNSKSVLQKSNGYERETLNQQSKTQDKNKKSENNEDLLNTSELKDMRQNKSQESNKSQSKQRLKSGDEKSNSPEVLNNGENTKQKNTEKQTNQQTQQTQLQSSLDGERANALKNQNAKHHELDEFEDIDVDYEPKQISHGEVVKPKTPEQKINQTQKSQKKPSLDDDKTQTQKIEAAKHNVQQNNIDVNHTEIRQRDNSKTNEPKGTQNTIKNPQIVSQNQGHQEDQFENNDFDAIDDLI